MKSFRLKRRKHRSRKLRSRKLRSRKLRKGGNGSSSSSEVSSKVSFDELKTLINKIKSDQKELIVENNEDTKNELKANINNDIQQLLYIFNKNKIDLKNLVGFANFILFEMIVDFTNFKETDRQIVQSYANHLLKNEVPWFNSRFFSLLIEEKKNMMIMDNNPIIIQKQIDNVEQIKAILDIPTTSALINNMSLTSKNYPRYSSSGQENLSTVRGLFPRPIVKHIMQFLTGSNFTHQAKNPKKWEDVEKQMLENIKPQDQQNILYLEDDKNKKRTLSQGSQNSQSSQHVNNSKKPRVKYDLFDIDGGRRSRRTNRRTNRRSNRRK